MDNCSRHKKEVAGITDMKLLAEMIGDLHYESMAELFDHLNKKLKYDSRRDWSSGKVSLSVQLKSASEHVRLAHHNINNAWQISKPFMDKKDSQ